MYTDSRECNWPGLVRDLMDRAFISQQELAEKLVVSQQTISAWLRGTRRPGQHVAHKLSDFCLKNGIEPGKYRRDQPGSRIIEYFQHRKGRELARILELYLDMDEACRGKLMARAGKMLSRRTTRRGNY